MKFWPRSLLYRLLLIVLLGLLLANGLSLTLVMIERMSSARNVMLGNLEQDVATSVAILNRLPMSGRNGCPSWRGAITATFWARGSPATRRTTPDPGMLYALLPTPLRAATRCALPLYRGQCRTFRPMSPCATARRLPSI